MWCKLDKGLVGVESLSVKLTKILVHRAQESLPIMLFELNEKLTKINQDIGYLLTRLLN